MKSVLKIILPVLCCTLLASACDVSPTDFDDPGATTASYPLTKIQVKDVHLFVAAKDFSGGYCLIPDSTSDGDTIPGFDTHHSFEGNVKKVNGKWYLYLSLRVDFPEEGVNQIVFFDDPQPRGFQLDIDSIEIGTVENFRPATCPDGSAQMKLAVLKTRWDPPNPPYIEGWKDFEEIAATLQLNLNVEEESEEEVRVTGSFELFSRVREKDDHGGGGYDDDEMLYSISGELEMD